ncbi:MAG: glycosyltransferase family 2 protein [Abitibacteriaceae bacterium]|nr:glycosyltransferase family 2 protein [Abditibacteriaceae bacterium]
MLSTPKKLSAIIACYRDAPAVPIMHERLVAVFEKLGADYEIIFVNDGSPDNAREVLTELAGRDKHVIVINHTRAFGSQNAFTSGMRIATGDAVILLDGDLQDPPEMIEPFYSKWQEGYDVVYGIRVKREATPFLKVAYKAFYRVFRKLSYVSIPLDAGDFSLIDRKVVSALNSLPENNRFLRGLRAWVGFKQTGVPYVRPERMFGRTTNSLLKNLGWARKAIFSFSYVPLDIITWLAITIVGFSTLAIIWQIGIRFFRPALTPGGFTTIIVLILFLGGIQLLCLSIIGSYLSHIYDEVKHRPPFLVESIINAPAAIPPTPSLIGEEPDKNKSLPHQEEGQIEGSLELLNKD